jgi:hypothetical protein
MRAAHTPTHVSHRFSFNDEVGDQPAKRSAGESEVTVYGCTASSGAADGTPPSPKLSGKSGNAVTTVNSLMRQKRLDTTAR